MSPYREGPAAPAPNVLICSGLDPSGGAGFLVDARVVQNLGGRPVGVITSLTVQNTRGMRSCHELDREVLGAQLNALLTDIEIRACKIGILGSQDVVRELGEHLDLTRAPVVWDPIIAPTQGDVLFGPELFKLALEALGRHLTLITPNSQELGLLVGAEITNLAEAVEGAKVFASIAKVAVLVKGGHLGTDQSVDVLCHEGGVEYLKGQRLPSTDVHGTGCALSSAIATHLALGLPLVDACREAKQYVAERIAHPVSPGRGAPAVL
ncbi:MAG: hydroxymethylpyrimidine/phosphomethylpyrimidine kinase [Deltaproteobacteria bacterium]|nr:hydroxymethylpyrimidine/phosphomethylpyrimidine kinase [Deltaproteobacteria bacterium]